MSAHSPDTRVRSAATDVSSRICPSGSAWIVDHSVRSPRTSTSRPQLTASSAAAASSATSVAHPAPAAARSGATRGTAAAGGASTAPTTTAASNATTALPLDVDTAHGTVEARIRPPELCGHSSSRPTEPTAPAGRAQRSEPATWLGRCETGATPQDHPDGAKRLTRRSQACSSRRRRTREPSMGHVDKPGPGRSPAYARCVQAARERSRTWFRGASALLGATGARDPGMARATSLTRPNARKAATGIAAGHGLTARCLNECPEGDLNPHAHKGTSTSS